MSNEAPQPAGYIPPAPPTGQHAGTPTTPPSDAVGQLTSQVRSLRLVAGIAAAASAVALVLSGIALARPAGTVGTAPTAPTTPAASAAATPAQTAVTKPKPADAGSAHSSTIVLGKPGANLPVLEIYEDFQCPACAQAEAVFGPQVNKLVASNTVEVRYHMMSFLDSMLGNDSSVRAANGGFCARDQDKFLEYHNTLFANHPVTEGTGWTDAQLAAHAATAGLDVPVWQACVASGKYADDVKNANDLALASGVNSTPTYAINGSKVDLSAVQSAGGFPTVIDSLR